MTENASMNDSILKRIQALLAKTEDRGATTSEAAASAAKAQELLVKYKLNLLDVEAANQAIDSRMPIMERIFNEDCRAWRNSLLECITKNMFTKAIIHNGNHGHRFSIVGTDTDIEVAVHLYRWVADQLTQLCGKDFAIREIEYMETHNELMPKQTRSQDAKWHDSWYMGAINVVGVRLRAYLSSDAAVTAVVVSNRADIDAFLEQQERKLHKGVTRYVGDNESYTRGQKAGTHVQFGQRPGEIGRGVGQLTAG